MDDRGAPNIKKVLILSKSLSQYRVDFFNQLKEELKNRNIELIFVYGKMKDLGNTKNDEVDLTWATYKENKVLSIGKINLLWQPVRKEIKEADLVIVEHANKLLINYYLMIIRPFSNMKFAFWGHGRNLQENENSFKNKLKNFYIVFCDHWFAYTHSVKTFLVNKDIPDNEITVLNNAIDTKTLKTQYIKCTDSEVDSVKKELNIVSYNIAVYSGSLYDIKKIDFLIKSAIKIRESIDDFHLIVVGSGPDSYIVEDAVKEYDWIHGVGAKFGEDRIVYFKMSSLFMLPGGVGLAILDAFVMQTPLVTTDIPLHGPEIDYLINNENGAITKFDIDIYSDKVISLFEDKNLLEKLKEGCTVSAKKYTVENMVFNFANGVENCLK